MYHHLSIYQSIHLSPSIHPSVDWSTYTSIIIRHHLSSSILISPSSHLNIFPSIHPSLFSPIHLSSSISLSLCPSMIYPSMQLSSSIFIYTQHHLVMNTSCDPVSSFCLASNPSLFFNPKNLLRRHNARMGNCNLGSYNAATLKPVSQLQIERFITLARKDFKSDPWWTSAT